MRNVRLIYKKQGRAKYISHLDMNRLMIRIIKRSKLPIWYTEGFNPHAFVTFALPLSLGFESEYDIMDFRITDDNLSNEEATEILKKAVPDSIKVVEIIEPVMKVKELAFAQFTLKVVCDRENLNKLVSFLNSDEIIVEKLTKKKQIKTFDVKAKIKDMKIYDENDSLKVDLLLPCGSEENINPMLIFDTALKQDISIDVESVVRGMLYDKKMNVFH